MSSIDSIKSAYERAKIEYAAQIKKKKYKDEQKAIKIVENLYPKLLKAARKRQWSYCIYEGKFFGPSSDVLKEVVSLVKQEGLMAVFIAENNWCSTPAFIQIWGW